MGNLVLIRKIDQETGEIVDIKGKEAKWFKANMKGFALLSKMDLKVVESRILFKLMGELKYNNKFYVNQTKWAEELKVSRESVNLGLKSLVDRGIIIKQSKTRNSVEYKLNTIYGWCGIKKND
jgi:predicted transcriptional regulator